MPMPGGARHCAPKLFPVQSVLVTQGGGVQKFPPALVWQKVFPVVGQSAFVLQPQNPPVGGIAPVQTWPFGLIAQSLLVMQGLSAHTLKLFSCGPVSVQT